MIKEIATQGKRARIEQSEMGYSITLYIDNRLLSKQTVHSIHEAEEIADNFIDNDISPTLLNESK